VRQLARSSQERGAPSHELDDFARWLFAETAGQPFFVAETLRALVERGALSRVPAHGGRWAVVPRAEVLREVTRQPFVSPEVRDVVRARVARLNPSTRTLLSAASVLGQAFDFSQLCQVADLAEASALPALDESLSAHLLREVPADGSAERSVYGFAHDKLRDVIYQETTEARRRVFHRRALENSAGDMAAAELAHHALAAGLKDQGLRYSTRAGDEAQRVLAAHDAISHYSTAIALAETAGLRDQLADLRVRRAQAYASIGRWADAREELTAVLPTLPALEDERRAELLVQLSAAHFWLLDIPGLRPHATEAVALASRVQRGDLEMSARGWLAGAEGGDGRLVASIEQYDRTVARARELGSSLPANVLTLHALVLYWLGRLDEATERSSAGVAAARLANDASILMYSLPHLGLALAARGRYDEAQATFDEAARFGREFAIHTLGARALAMSAGYHLDLCDYAGHEALAEEARELARTTGFPPPAASAGIDLLLNYARRGDVGRAEALVDGVATAVEHAAGFHGWLWRLRLAQARAEIALARGEWEDALGWANRAIGQSRTTERPKYLALALGARALALNALGQSALGMESAREALTIACRLDDPALVLRLSTQLPDLSDDPKVALKVEAAAQRIRRAMSNPDLRQAAEAGFRLPRRG
jgi:tetratricopeptide (TPR) repeat protein